MRKGSTASTSKPTVSKSRPKTKSQQLWVPHLQNWALYEWGKRRHTRVIQSKHSRELVGCLTFGLRITIDTSRERGRRIKHKSTAKSTSLFASCEILFGAHNTAAVMQKLRNSRLNCLSASGKMQLFTFCTPQIKIITRTKFLILGELENMDRSDGYYQRLLIQPRFFSSLSSKSQRDEGR
jgi:hypothetical protein